MSYYEQISDEKKDLGSILDAKLNFEFVLNNLIKPWLLNLLKTRKKVSLGCFILCRCAG